ncbi:aromatic ring-hydroxylating oxygenase subunit alpha [Candidatus Pandoraea novymonadis]|nr:aromatic ring-hydroxylating dioxygenase subunit alpha [Candidatus Pandoraea novymonadis]
MSNISSDFQPKPTASQLPVHLYFDESFLRWELDILFKNSPRYIGHELMVPDYGDYFALPAENEGRMLIRNYSSEHGVDLLSNVCRHRQSIMLNGRGNVSNIVCPLHRWTYNTTGELLGTPHFTEKPCLNLGKFPLQRWNGLLFENQGRNVQDDLAKLSVKRHLDFSGYMFDHMEIHDCNYNWKTFIEVYLEDYHVVPFHPGLGSFISCDELRWEFGDWYSIQTVGLRSCVDKQSSPIYHKWHNMLLKYNQGKLPTFGAIWMLYYPYLMIEWYPHVLIVSWLIPRNPQKTTNIVEYYYLEEISLFEREFIEVQRAAYTETAREDDQIAERMDAGRRVLFERGVSEIGPYQSPMEDGMRHFHQFLRSQMENF